MAFLRANGGVVHYRDEGPRVGARHCFINALGSDLRIWDDVAGAPLARLPRRPLRQARPRPQRSRPRPDTTWRLRARPRGSPRRAGRRARDNRRALHRRAHRPGALSSARPELFAALVLSDTAAKIGDDASWDARIAAIETGGLEAVADGVLQRWFTGYFRERPRRRADGMARHARPHAGARLPRSLRRAETRRPASFRRRDLGSDPVSRRRRGRLDAGRAGARDRRPRSPEPGSRSSQAPATFPGSSSRRRPRFSSRSTRAICDVMTQRPMRKAERAALCLRSRERV